MGRVEQFRSARKMRWRYLGSFVLFFTLLIAGICTVDYSVNSIARNVNRVELISFRNIENSYYEVNLANKKFYINTTYIKRDYQRLKDKIFGMLGGG